MPNPVKLEEALTEIDRLYDDCLVKTQQFLDEKNLADGERLEQLLMERSSRMERIESIETCFSTDEEGAFIFTFESVDNKKRVESLAAEIRSKVESLTQCDEAIRTAISGEMKTIDDDLTRMIRGRQTLKAYAPFKAHLSVLIDAKG